MTTSFPTALDSLLNPSATTEMDDSGYEHDLQHANSNDAIEALEAKVGIDSSAVTTSHDYKLAALASHGPSFHTDVARYLWIRVPDMQVDGTAGAFTYGTAPDAWQTRQLADGATNGVAGALVIPSDCSTNSALDINIYWVADGTDAVARSVRWSINTLVVSDAAAMGDVRTAGTTTAFTNTATAYTQYNMYRDARSGIATVNAGDLLRLNVRRVGGHADDNFAQTVSPAMLRLQYTATG